MKDLVPMIFKGLAWAFDNIPLLNKLKGYRSVLGFVGLAVVNFLQLKGIGDASYLYLIEVGFQGFTALALNAKVHK